MKNGDIYHTILKPSIGEFKDRGSKFFAYAYPLMTKEDWQQPLLALKKEHFKARHHCYAFRFGTDGNYFRANDDGEPSGTAGRPILGQIDSFGLTNVVLIVVRYFGGTKLGASGLINAYKQSAFEALQQAEIIEKYIKDVYALDFDYGNMSSVMAGIKQLELEMLEQKFEENVRIKVAIRQSLVENALITLRAKVANISLEEASTKKSVEGLKMDYLATI